MRIRQERSEKERMKDDFKQRLEINNVHWELNLVSIISPQNKRNYFIKKGIIFIIIHKNIGC